MIINQQKSVTDTVPIPAFDIRGVFARMELAWKQNKF